MTARNDNETYNQPLGGNEMPRFAGPSTMFRLPSQTTAAGLDIAILGVPLDIGTSLRPGAGWYQCPAERRVWQCPIRLRWSARADETWCWGQQTLAFRYRPVVGYRSRYRCGRSSCVSLGLRYQDCFS